MAYQLRHAEAVAAATRRLLAEQVDGALDDLRVPDGPGAGADERAAAVHSARKHLKRARSVLRLVRDALGSRSYRQLAQPLRDAGRLLSDLRDAHVLVETLESLADDVGAARVAQVRATLQARVDDDEATAGDVSPLRQAVALLQQARDDIDALRLRGGDAGILRGGLRRIHGQARERFDEAVADPSDERLHEWRKRVKDSWYQVSLLTPAWPDVLGPLEDAAHRLSEQLGSDHDLAVLRARLLELPADEHTGTRQALLDAIDGRRERLQHDAVALGRRLYADPPKVFARRLVAVWQAWRDDPHVTAPAQDSRRVAEPVIPAPALGSVETPAVTVGASSPRSVDTRLAAPALGSREPAAAPARAEVAANAAVLPAPPLGSVEGAAVPAARGDGSAPTAPAPDLVAAPSGKRYHRSGCALAGSGAQPVSARDVRARGLLACTVCRPHLRR